VLVRSANRVSSGRVGDRPRGYAGRGRVTGGRRTAHTLRGSVALVPRFTGRVACRDALALVAQEPVATRRKAARRIRLGSRCHPCLRARALYRLQRFWLSGSWRSEQGRERENRGQPDDPVPAGAGTCKHSAQLAEAPGPCRARHDRHDPGRHCQRPASMSTHWYAILSPGVPNAKRYRSRLTSQSSQTVSRPARRAALQWILDARALVAGATLANLERIAGVAVTARRARTR
jgi:hypothetical protein